MYVDAASVFTNEDDRDNHLKSADFFDVEKYKELLFESMSTEQVDDENFKLKGLLTIKEVSKEVTLNAELGGIDKEP